MPRRGINCGRGVRTRRRRFGVVAALVVAAAGFAAIGCVRDHFADAEAMRTHLSDHGRALTRQAVLACRDHVGAPREWPKLAEYVASLVAADPAIEFAVVQRVDGQTIAAHPAGVVPHRSESTLLLVEPILAERDEAESATFFLGLSTEPMLAASYDRAWRRWLRQSLVFLCLGVVSWLVLRPRLLRPRASLEEQNQRLLELDRLKSQFLANMSHELRTPLTSILGGTQLLSDPTTPLADRVAIAASVERNGRDMLDLVDRLLDLTKLETDNLLIETRTCRVAQEVVDACDAARMKAMQKGLEMTVDVSRVRDVAIESDPARLRQAVRAIVDNAVKFTEAGRVSVRAEILESPSRSLRIVVEDTGVGMPDDLLGRDFVPFRQADGSLTRRHGGSGLGLYITQQVVRRLGGDLALRRRDGGGTCAEIVVAAKAVMPRAPRARDAEKPRVLVVDDAPDNRHLLKAVLTKLGASVEVAENGRVAVDRVVSASREQPDLVLMDLQMPELDGLGAIRELRSAGFDGPIVALTAHALADDRDAALAAGADGYETKPVSMQRLGEIVGSHVR